MTIAARAAMVKLFTQEAEKVTVVFGVHGEDGKDLSRPLLARAARLTWGWESLLPLERSARGKPEFRDRPGYWMSLSHSGGYALCALSDDGPVGVDIEVVRPHRAGLPAYALSQAELARFDGSWEDFARLWTRKESWCKRQDLPLFPPRRAEVPADCPCRSYRGDGWAAAACCSGTPPTDLFWLDREELRKP